MSKLIIMLERIVGKGGGTSHATPEAVAESMQWAELTDIFVASAPGKLKGQTGLEADKVTDMLLAARSEYVSKGDVDTDTLDAITSRYEHIVTGLSGLALDGAWVDRIPGRVTQAAIMGLDAASMLGERLMAEIYLASGNYKLLDPGTATGDLGTDPGSWKAWLESVYQPNKKYVLLGNTTYLNGQLKTFDRGGSDTSSGFAAYGINADVNWNLTDGPAETADPRLIGLNEDGNTRTKHIEHLLYYEGRELGRNGTNLLHPAAMVPLMIGNIPTEIRATDRLKTAYTLVDNDTERAAHRVGKVVALSLMNDVYVHRVHEPGMAEAVGRLDAFESELAQHGIALVDSQGDGVDAQHYFVGGISESKTNKGVNEKLSQDAQDVLATATSPHGSAEVCGPLSFISLVGNNLNSRVLTTINDLWERDVLNVQEWEEKRLPLTIGRYSIRIGVDPKESEQLFSDLHKAIIEES